MQRLSARRAGRLRGAGRAGGRCPAGARAAGAAGARARARRSSRRSAAARARRGDDSGDGRKPGVDRGARERLAVAGRGHARGVPDGRDRAERLRGLRVRARDASLDIHAGEVLVVAVAGLEDLVARGVGRVVVAPDAVVDVLAEVRRVRAGGVARFQAEAVRADEAAGV